MNEGDFIGMLYEDYKVRRYTAGFLGIISDRIVRADGQKYYLEFWDRNDPRWDYAPNRMNLEFDNGICTRATRG